MAGTKEGGKKVAKSLKERFGEDYYRRIGAKGGKAKVPKGFALNKELASKAGRKGGKKSKRRPKETELGDFIRTPKWLNIRKK